MMLIKGDEIIITLNFGVVMTEKIDVVQEIIQEVFEKTNLKVTADDPAIVFVIGLRDILEKHIRDYQETLLAFNHTFIDKTQNQLDYANEYFVNNSQILHDELKEQFGNFLSSIDEKNKELNFVLAKIQGEYDKQTSERFTEYFKQISDENAKVIEKIQSIHDENLKRQRKIDTSKQRDVLMAGAGFVVGLIICLLVVFIVK